MRELSVNEINEVSGAYSWMQFSEDAAALSGMFWGVAETQAVITDGPGAVGFGTLAGVTAGVSGITYYMARYL